MSDHSLKRKLAAILFADAVGYSRLTGSDEDSTFRQINDYLALFTRIVEAHRGTVIHYAGDAILADFPTVTSALSCALEARNEIKRRNQDVPSDRQVWFRTGINLGEVICEQQRIFGDGVNVAARLEGIAAAGEICLSESARSAVGNKLDLRYEFMGEQRFKNIAQPVHAYRVLEDSTEAPGSIPCPYPGMVPFTGDQSGYFWGRHNEINRMVSLLRKQHFLMLIGPSGSGKSSLMYAGLLPALDASRYFGHDYWLVRSMRPGADPVKRLADVLDYNDSTDIVDNGSVDRILHGVPQQKLLLLVDQFEEVFTLADADERKAFISQLLAFRAIKDAALILTFRADFYPDLMNSYLWPVDVSERIEIAPLKGEALREAIVKPAQEVNVKLSDELVNQLLSDASDEPGVLPLLQETMSLLWDEMENRSLTLSAYQRLSSGAATHLSDNTTGLAVAIAMKADRALQELSLSQRAIARRIFLRLIQFGEGRADTRRQQPVAALRSIADEPGELENTLEHLTDNRLLTRSVGEHNQPSVDISHESLINSWTRLQDWADQRREAEKIRRRLEGKAKEWQRLGSESAGLLSEVELPEAEHWLASADAEELGYEETLPALVTASKDSLDKARNEREEQRQLELRQAEALAREQQQRLNEQAASAARLRRTLTGLAAALLIAIGAGYFGWAKSREADSRTVEAQLAEHKATELAAAESSARQLAERQKLEAEKARLESVAQLLAIQVPQQQAGHQDERAALMAVQAKHFSASAGRQLSSSIDSVLRTVASKPYFSQIINPATTYSVALSPDGRYLAAVHAAPYQVELWDLSDPVSTAEILEGYPGEKGLYPISMVFADNGNSLIAASPDGSMVQWQLDQSDRPISNLPQHDDGVWSLAISPDQQLLAIGSKRTDSFSIRNLAQAGSDPLFVKGSDSTDHGQNPASGVAVAFSHDGLKLASSSENNTINIWQRDNFSTPQHTLKAHSGTVLSLSFANDNKRLASSASDETVRLWDLNSATPEGRTIGTGYSASSLVFSADDKTVFSAGLGLKAWPVTGNAQPVNLSSPVVAYSVAISPDGQTLVTGGTNGANGLNLWDTSDSGQPVHLPGHEKLVLSVAFNADGNLLATAGNPADKKIQIWNWNDLSGQPRVLPLQPGATNSLQFSRDSSQLLTTSWNTNTTAIWNLSETPASQQPVYLEGPHKPWTALFSPDEKQVLITGTRGIYKWDRESTETPAVNVLPTEKVMFGLHYSPDGRYLATSGFGDTIYIQDQQNPQAGLISLKGHSDEGSRTIDFSADGKLLASGGQDGSVRLWSPHKPDKPSIILGHHDDAVNRVRISPDGQWLASAGKDHKVQLWDLQSPAELPIVLSAFNGPIFGLDYHPSGDYLAVGGLVESDGTGVKIWNLSHPVNNARTDTIAELLCQKVRRNLSLEEWRTMVGDSLPYERTCANLPVHPSLLETAESLLQSGEKEQADALLQRISELDESFKAEPVAMNEQLSVDAN